MCLMASLSFYSLYYMQLSLYCSYFIFTYNWFLHSHNILQLTLYSMMLCQLHNWILREFIFLYGSWWSLLKLIFLDGIVYEDWISSWFTYVYKDILVNRQGCNYDFVILNTKPFYSLWLRKIKERVTTVVVVLWASFSRTGLLKLLN